MTVVDALYYLPPQELGFQLWHLAVGLKLQVAMQRPAVDVLHNQEHLFVRLKCLIQFGDVGVV